LETAGFDPKGPGALDGALLVGQISVQVDLGRGDLLVAFSGVQGCVSWL
jgi:hypothetical protein